MSKIATNMVAIFVAVGELAPGGNGDHASKVSRRISTSSARLERGDSSLPARRVLFRRV
jgi:hypothetical protein